MNLQEARRVVSDEDNASLGRLLRAAWELCNPENESQVSIHDLLACLKRGSARTETKQVAEIAALSLYMRTRRPRKENHRAYEDFVTDFRDWEDYLREHKLI